MYYQSLSSSLKFCTPFFIFNKSSGTLLMPNASKITISIMVISDESRDTGIIKNAAILSIFSTCEINTKTIKDKIIYSENTPMLFVEKKMMLHQKPDTAPHKKMQLYF